VTDKRETDAELATRSATFLDTMHEMRDLERQKRDSARSSDEFHELADRVEQKARETFELAKQQNVAGEEDSPIASEREEQYPGDWTRSQRH
jgi:hypothetical protein